ncbi:urease accessory protein UreE [Nitrosococcus oceani]|uniref:Urease accessory protein UreE n=2 Tax=Nitrosococcus oceani TaxID=1229 RepID=UREE_NITOC|nr:urease accessory protein UreE [Nitrosococcus oceani]Q3J771.1 RecName: Full=Urease accessory protein UreE [Nitrosococcus oceani ATCC 19707]KFI18212.1 urease accessory protein UreE [Nitrosococcus oceani C-27]ABA59325.1 UreE urease accessory-like protein [Nitrosococcus oceani ATCC 19707]EDZ66404.1 UreE urease accessory protein, C-terminal domain [Nitrosococcus oceani AFC27]KFI21529.1 urease accessory protein UreE [Nitrosococcus oceani]GEM20105.1 urease accessory protein UreE [Nitrosococcus oc
MLCFERRLPSDTPADLEMAFTFEQRERSRLRFPLPDGREAAFLIERGAPLVEGERLGTAEGLVLAIQAKPELLMEVRTSDPLTLVRAAYHLGNRHVRLEIGAHWLRLPPDYVLRDMLMRLGVEVFEVTAPYQPESGAYGGGHHHSHSHHEGDEFHSKPRLHHFGGSQ